MTDPTKAELEQEALDELAAWIAEIEAEPDPAKKRRIFEKHQDELNRKLAGATVEWVEQVRAREGDDAAEELLKTLRSIQKKR